MSCLHIRCEGDLSPFFSICIPAYNCGDILYKALESVAGQTFQDWEVIVLDDGSTDDTVDICAKQTAVPDARYRLVRAEHGGLLRARMALLAEACGEVIISLDADDELIGEDALDKIHQAFEKHGCDMVMFNATRSLETMSPFVDYTGLDLVGSGAVDLASARRLFCSSYNLNNVAFKAYRRSLLPTDLGVPPLIMTEDRWQSAGLFDACRLLSLINEPLYYYRVNESSITEKEFRLGFFRDQMTVEAKVDELSRGWGVDRSGNERLLAQIFFGDLIAIRRSVPSRLARSELYRGILAEERYRERIAPLCASRLRLDHAIALSLFSAGHFRMLDAFLWARGPFAKMAKRACGAVVRRSR